MNAEQFEDGLGITQVVEDVVGTRGVEGLGWCMPSGDKEAADASGNSAGGIEGRIADNPGVGSLDPSVTGSDP